MHASADARMHACTRVRLQPFYPEHRRGVNKNDWIGLWWFFLRHPIAVQGFSRAPRRIALCRAVHRTVRHRTACIRARLGHGQARGRPMATGSRRWARRHRSSTPSHTRRCRWKHRRLYPSVHVHRRRGHNYICHNYRCRYVRVLRRRGRRGRTGRRRASRGCATCSTTSSSATASSTSSAHRTPNP